MMHHALLVQTKHVLSIVEIHILPPTRGESRQFKIDI